ncbi:hypothetical protein RUM43_011241 [Polyplax serrata]|uniref:Uncharacterized protein n=1 Tax=Polyplax serrata TaxID=468196 RepID=A0AAN8S0Y3_POLSC
MCSNSSSIQQLIANEQPLSTNYIGNLTEQIDIDDVVFNDGTTSKKRKSPSNATLQSIDLDGFDNLDEIDQVQIVPNSFENIIMSNIDRTLHGGGHYDVKSTSDTPETHLTNPVGGSPGGKTTEPNLSASKLRRLQESTMIESALDLDTLEEQSVVSINSGNSSQTGLLKFAAVSQYE